MWFNELDEDFQKSWKLLRPALLERFPVSTSAPTAPTPDPTPIAPPPASHLIPTPASASPPPSARPSSILRDPSSPWEASVSQGPSGDSRAIQLVDYSTGDFVGYISRRGGCLVTKQPYEALIVDLPKFRSKGEPLKFRMEVGHIALSKYGRLPILQTRAELHTTVRSTDSHQ